LVLADPDPAFAGLALLGECPFENANDFKPALKRAIEHVEKRERELRRSD
jgi:hypothetical protein